MNVTQTNFVDSNKQVRIWSIGFHPFYILNGIASEPKVGTLIFFLVSLYVWNTDDVLPPITLSTVFQLVRTGYFSGSLRYVSRLL